MKKEVYVQLVIQILVLLSTIYLGIVQTLHYCKTFRNKSRTPGKKLSFLLSFLPVVIFIDIVLEMTRLSYNEFHPEAHATLENVLLYLGMAFYIITLCMVYSVLWLRQRSFYTNAALNDLTNKHARLVSKYLLIVIITLSTLILICSITLLIHPSCSLTCWFMYVKYMKICFPILTQASLLTLFFYPLLKYRTSNSVSVKKYVSLMKRVGMLTVICLLSDIVSVVIAFHWRSRLPSNLNLLTNLLCIIFSTLDWKERFIPYCCHETNLSRDPADGYPASQTAECQQSMEI